MPRISRSTLLVSIAIMIAIVAAACDTAVEKPTAEPPTPVPTVVVESASTSDEERPLDGSGRIRAPGDRVGSGIGSLTDPEVQECLVGQLGIDMGPGEFDLGALRQLDPAETAAAFEACGAALRRPGSDGGGILGGGGFVGGGFADPEVRDCLTDILGEDALDNLGQGSGIGLGDEWLSAMEECGLNFGDGGGGFRFGGREGAFGGDDGIFGDLGGFGDDGSYRECLIAELGDDALSLLRDTGGAPSAELQAAFAKCDSGMPIPVEPDGGIGDGAGPIPIEPLEVPVSELTIEQLTCLSGALDSSALTDAVIATSSGDLSEIPDEVLAALQACGVGA